MIVFVDDMNVSYNGDYIGNRSDSIMNVDIIMLIHILRIMSSKYILLMIDADTDQSSLYDPYNNIRIPK